MSKKFQERLARSSGFSSKQFKSNFGLKVLKKFGWEEGKGLGKNEDGRDECIQQRRRDGNAGLGAEKKTNDGGWDNWWCDVFNNAAQRIASNATQENNDAPDSSDSEDEDAKMTGGVRTTAIKSASRMAGKLKRVVRQEANQPATTRSPTPASTPSRKAKKATLTAEVQEEIEAAELATGERPSGNKKRKGEKRRSDSEEESTSAIADAENSHTDQEEKAEEDEEARAARKKRRKTEKAAKRALAEEAEPLMSPEMA